MDPVAPAESLAALSINGEADSSNPAPARTRRPKSKGKAKVQGDDGDTQAGSASKKTNASGAKKPNPQSTKLRGLDKDSPEVRVSKTISWLLRHGAQGEGLAMRKDGYVKVVDMLNHPKLKAQGLTLEGLKDTVRADSKQRFDLILESPAGVKLLDFGAEPLAIPAVEAGVGASAEGIAPSSSAAAGDAKEGIWWIKARQGHSIKTVHLDLKPINSVKDIPTGVAVHGTNKAAWDIISRDGLSKMKRNHIHLAQNVAGQNVVSGMRTSSQILIFIDVQKALDAGIKFWLSDNGVVLTEGDDRGYLSKRFFEKVVDVRGVELHGWEET